jgi:sugar O-acyltransferase (sialic acid O-acetyltransferase NeuD family)
MLESLNDTKVAIVGYSGHAFVAIDILQTVGYKLVGYTDFALKKFNPFDLIYLGNDNEMQTIEQLKNYKYFVGIGDNTIRKAVTQNLIPHLGLPINAIHKQSIMATNVELGEGILIAAGTTINPCVSIGDGVICNTNASIDHECIIEPYVHIAPGAVLCGNVHVGENSFIGANSVIKQGIQIGKNVTIGAGSVIVKNILEEGVYAGNPAKKIK